MCSRGSARALRPDVANSVAWYCVLAPEAVPDRDAPVRLAEAALAGFPEASKKLVLNTLGGARTAQAGSTSVSAVWTRASRPWDGEGFPSTGYSWRWPITVGGSRRGATVGSTNFGLQAGQRVRPVLVGRRGDRNPAARSSRLFAVASRSPLEPLHRVPTRFLRKYAVSPCAM